MKIFGFLIPTGTKREIDEVESFTVNWTTETYYKREVEHYKVFLKEQDANDFIVQLKEAVKLLGGVPFDVTVKRN